LTCYYSRIPEEEEEEEEEGSSYYKGALLFHALELLGE